MSKRESVLEDLCDKIIDVIHKIFTKKYYTIRISQAKNGNIYLIVQKKRMCFLGEERLCLCEKNHELVSVVFSWYCKKSRYLSDYYFVDFKLIRQCSGYHFHFLLIYRDKYVNSCF